MCFLFTHFFVYCSGKQKSATLDTRDHALNAILFAPSRSDGPTSLLTLFACPSEPPPFMIDIFSFRIGTPTSMLPNPAILNKRHMVQIGDQIDHIAVGLFGNKKTIIIVR